MGCKKDDIAEASKVRIETETMEKGWDYIKINVEYDYPVELEAVTLYLSEKEDMSDANVYECNVEGKKFSAELDSLKAGVAYYYCYEYDNGYEKVKSDKSNLNTVSKLEVVTKDVTNIKATTVTFNGSVINSDAANKITERGFCWGTEKNPTIEGNYISNGNGAGNFTSNILNLIPNTKYYVRAYAKTNFGIVYGEEVSFTTLEKLLPVVTTAEVTDITISSATCGGEITFDGNVAVTARGVCWSTSPNPTIEKDNKINNGSGTGSFTSYMSGLQDGTTYYVRAYATNEKGTSYGEEKSFATLKKVLPTVTTNTVTNIKATTATCGGYVSSDGNGTVTARGICWSTKPNPTISDSKTTDGSGTGSYTSYLSNLAYQTTYYVRAYATNEKGTSYGEQKSFTTLDKYNGHEYVDLGLPSGLLWATCNVGATSPEEYGNYYAWGETTTKANYNGSNCPTHGLSNSELQSQGYIDGEGNLTAQYDAATANWGGEWRMPTKAEQEELLNNCTCTWTTQNGVNGYNVEGPNGNSIFLPAAGSRTGLSLNGAWGGVYWSSTPDEFYDGSYAYGLGFNSGDHIVGYGDRYYGLSVRPVIE